MRLIAVFLFSMLAWGMAQAEPASGESIEHLLVATKSESMINSVRAQLEPMMRQAMQQAIAQKTQNRPLTDDEQQSLSRMVMRIAGVFNEEFTWEKMKPQFVQIYVDTFTQKEVDDMLAFYKTPSGQALIDKMPAVMQKSMAISQTMMQRLLPKMQAAIAESANEFAGK